MIIEYDDKYIDEVKNLFVELGKYIASIDQEKYHVITSGYRDKYFEETMEEISKCSGKMFLYKENNRIIGLVVGLINNEAESSYDFKVPKRGRITELIVSKRYRQSGTGTKLLNYVESYLKNNGCKAILLEVFAYNESAINFYIKNGYHNRVIDMIKID